MPHIKPPPGPRAGPAVKRGEPLVPLQSAPPGIWVTLRRGSLRRNLTSGFEAQVKCLNPTGYMEEINSFRHFGRNAGSFVLEIIAIADWGQKFMDAGFNYPIPAFPQYLFSQLPESCWAGHKSPPSQTN